MKTDKIQKPMLNGKFPYTTRCGIEFVVVAAPIVPPAGLPDLQATVLSRKAFEKKTGGMAWDTWRTM